MMKSYTVTYCCSLNYGAFLQGYALQQRLGKTNSVVKFKRNFLYYVGEKGRKRMPFLWPIVALFRFLKSDRKELPDNGRLNYTWTFTNVKQLKGFFAKEDAAYIVGSDQIWNPCPILKNFYFLDFAPEGARRISYAASLGVKSWPPDFAARVLPMLKKFDAISVREESSVPYLTSLGLKNVVCVCDPTILHTGDFYRNEFPYEKCESDFTFVYRIREEIPESVRSIFCKEVKEVHLQKRRTIVSVTEWLRSIDCAKFVITDSFHCVVFCILFHKPFLVIPNRSTGKGMNERFSTLLGKTGLEYRCLTCEESCDEVLQKLNVPIDWEKVDTILDEWRAYSANWLKNALGE